MNYKRYLPLKSLMLLLFSSTLSMYVNDHLMFKVIKVDNLKKPLSQIENENPAAIQNKINSLMQKWYDTITHFISKEATFNTLYEIDKSENPLKNFPYNNDSKFPLMFNSLGFRIVFLFIHYKPFENFIKQKIEESIENNKLQNTQTYPLNVLQYILNNKILILKNIDKVDIAGYIEDRYNGGRFKLNSLILEPMIFNLKMLCATLNFLKKNNTQIQILMPEFYEDIVINFTTFFNSKIIQETTDLIGNKNLNELITNKGWNIVLLFTAFLKYIFIVQHNARKKNVATIPIDQLFLLNNTASQELDDHANITDMKIILSFENNLYKNNAIKLPQLKLENLPIGKSIEEFWQIILPIPFKEFPNPYAAFCLL